MSAATGKSGTKSLLCPAFQKPLCASEAAYYCIIKAPVSGAKARIRQSCPGQLQPVQTSHPVTCPDSWLAIRAAQPRGGRRARLGPGPGLLTKLVRSVPRNHLEHNPF